MVLKAFLLHQEKKKSYKYLPKKKSYHKTLSILLGMTNLLIRINKGFPSPAFAST